MKTISLLLVSALISLGTFAQETSDRTVMVGGSEMSSYKNVVANIMNSKEHTKLVALLRSAGLVTTLQGPGPFTVFAPTNDAFMKMGATPSKSTLTKVLKYHVIDGKWDSNDIMAGMNGNGGSLSLKTMQGGSLKFSMIGGDLMVTDENGMTAKVTTKDIYQSNGVAHVIDSVLMPFDNKKVVSMSDK
ncbi:fasciclin domain-containing protein [Emticicia sp. BO119]|uniref:fasciclin domain-containing protein n=1 Tax=Emticicia sp. BO119 TaxID=2757768 RepID=UPI0015F0E30C|nr:fasciclin domain-containing protein [Emticicia sp. BO119]MBA4853712.1 fasciclin domain-containing protein [Emticicia sp. BO119]